MTERTKAKETTPKSQHIIQLPNALPISPSQNQVEKPSLSLREENPHPLVSSRTSSRRRTVISFLFVKGEEEDAKAWAEAVRVREKSMAQWQAPAHERLCNPRDLQVIWVGFWFSFLTCFSQCLLLFFYSDLWMRFTALTQGRTRSGRRSCLLLSWRPRRSCIPRPILR